MGRAVAPSGAWAATDHPRKAYSMDSQNPRPSRHRARMAALAGGVALCLAGVPLFANFNHAGAAPETSATTWPSFNPLVKRVLPAVVNVSVKLKSDVAASDESDQ